MCVEADTVAAVGAADVEDLLKLMEENPDFYFNSNASN